MQKLLISFLFLIMACPLFAVDYTEMSTQELIEIMGYVEKENLHKFEKELKSRVPTMTQKERDKYLQNLKKIKK
ncbi:DUF1104 domain-containing protein [Halarcobacter ebronensis]|uniref:DUF1104 domain-containing protein n=1 Tax=Halarcobacter ebronensis TaxID=1462615 RepID=A0A4Q0YHE4_9BACT|nr:DUF1104 domain-containing protein [Halarcobacter ebronensis]RXJ70056.1 DUF1104 domain-containing protein [Halarcobacter ebronensis]